MCFVLCRFISSLDAAEAIQGTHQYIKASRSLGAVLQLSSFFSKYKDIESVGVTVSLISRSPSFFNVSRLFVIRSARRYSTISTRSRIWSTRSKKGPINQSLKICWKRWSSRSQDTMISWSREVDYKLRVL